MDENRKQLVSVQQGSSICDELSKDERNIVDDIIEMLIEDSQPFQNLGKVLGFALEEIKQFMEKWEKSGGLREPPYQMLRCYKREKKLDKNEFVRSLCEKMELLNISDAAIKKSKYFEKQSNRFVLKEKGPSQFESQDEVDSLSSDIECDGAVPTMVNNIFCEKLEAYSLSSCNIHVRNELKEIKNNYSELEKIQDSLRNCYLNNAILPEVCWFKEKVLPLEKFYVDLTMYSKDKNGIENEGEIIELMDIFNPVNGKIENRILIEGQPGFGKTTLTYKLVYDWARKSDYIFLKFSLVFLIPVRNFADELEKNFHKLLETTLLEDCHTEDISDETILEILTQHESKILVILDGYDEVNSDLQKRMLPFLIGEYKSKMSVILTSRTGKFYLEKSVKNNQRKGGFAKMGRANSTFNPHFWKKRIEVKGLSDENQKLFLSKYLESESCSIINKVKGLSRDICELCKSPLILYLLALLVEEDEFDQIKTRTSLYKVICEYVIKRNLCDRENLISEDSQINLFNPIDGSAAVLCKEYPLEKLMNLFGKFSLDNLLKDKLHFDEKSILNTCGSGNSFILNLGFLTKNLFYVKHVQTPVYEPIHKTFLEFWAAYHQCRHFRPCSENLEFNRKIADLIENNFGPKEESLFYPFLLGLLEENCHLLFTALKPYRVFYPVNEVAFDLMLDEIEIGLADIVDLILPFVPKVWENDSDFLNFNIRRSVLEKSMKLDIIQDMKWDLFDECEFPNDFYVRKLHGFVLDPDITDGLNSIKGKNISCSELIISITKFRDSTWESLEKIISLINFERLTIEVRPFYSNKLVIFDRKSEPTNFFYYRLNLVQLNERTDAALLQTLTTMINDNRILKGLCLRISKINRKGNSRKHTNGQKGTIKNENLDDLLTAVVYSKSIDEFCLTIDCYCSLSGSINIAQISNKVWKKLYLSGNIILQSCENCQLEANVFGLRIGADRGTDENRYRTQTNTIQSLFRGRVRIAKLDCSENLCHQLPLTLDINEMKINFSKFDLKTFRELAKRTNLSSLTLNFEFLKIEEVSGLTKEAIEEIAGHLVRMQLQNIEFTGVTDITFRLVAGIIEKVRSLFFDLRKDEFSSCVCLCLQLGFANCKFEGNKLESIFKDFQRLLCERLVQNIAIYSTDTDIDIWQPQILKFFSPANGFEIEREIIDTLDENTFFNSWISFNSVITSLCFTLKPSGLKS